jgi:hypothetical protein
MHVVVRTLSEKDAKRKVSNRLNSHRATKEKSSTAKEPPSRAVTQPAKTVCATPPRREISDHMNVAVKICPLDKKPLQLSRNIAASAPVHPRLQVSRARSPSFKWNAVAHAKPLEVTTAGLEPKMLPQLPDEAFHHRCHAPKAISHASPSQLHLPNKNLDVKPPNTPCQELELRRRIEASIDGWLNEAAEFVLGR